MPSGRLTKKDRVIQATLSYYLHLAKHHGSADEKESEEASAIIEMDAGTAAQELLNLLELPQLTWVELQKYLEVPPQH